MSYIVVPSSTTDGDGAGAGEDVVPDGSLGELDVLGHVPHPTCGLIQGAELQLRPISGLRFPVGPYCPSQGIPQVPLMGFLRGQKGHSMKVGSFSFALLDKEHQSRRRISSLGRFDIQGVFDPPVKSTGELYLPNPPPIGYAAIAKVKGEIPRTIHTSRYTHSHCP